MEITRLCDLILIAEVHIVETNLVETNLDLKAPIAEILSVGPELS